MSDGKMSRRGLLGILAAAPVVAATAKPAEAARGAHNFAVVKDFKFRSLSESNRVEVVMRLRRLMAAQICAPALDRGDETCPPEEADRTPAATKSDAAAGIEGRTSPSDPFFAPAAASDAEHPVLKLARAE